VIKTQYRIQQEGPLAYWQVLDARGNSLATGASNSVNRSRVEALLFATARERHIDVAENEVADLRKRARQALIAANDRAGVIDIHEETYTVAAARTERLVEESLAALVQSRALLLEADKLFAVRC
jgi:acetolactate synthase small subunit